MRFDDRLATVLRHRAVSPHAALTQFRQLLDLLDQPRDARDSSLLASAWLRLGALGETIPAQQRAAVLRDPSVRIRTAELAIHLAEDEPAVAAAALERADLSPDDWDALIPRLPIRARGFLRLRHNLPQTTVDLLERLGIHDRGLPLPDNAAAAPGAVEPDLAQTTADQPPEPVAIAEAIPEVENESSEIGALVKRIEAFRLARTVGVAEGSDAPRLPLGDKQSDPAQNAPAGFGFTSDASGRIDWAEPAVAAAVIGTMLADCMIEAGAGSGGATAMARRQPLRAQVAGIAGAPVLAGQWIVDAAPRFAEVTGSFAGYAGRFRRPLDLADASSDGSNTADADRLRQLLHELRTPINAIQGYAEVIQQQLFGAAPHEYRALAATIAGDAARIMAGFDELDRLARLETGALDLDSGACDFAAIAERQLAQLMEVLQPRMAGFDVTLAPGPCPIALAPAEGEALAWRLLATVAGAISAGEQLTLTLDRTSHAMQLVCALPASLASESDVFAATARAGSGVLSAGAFGAGFALRLVRAEARAAGGTLERSNDTLRLVLPLLTGIERVPSASQVAGADTGKG